MTDELNVAELEVTKEVLDKLGINVSVLLNDSGEERKPEERIDLYSKYFCQLYKGLRERFR